MKIFALALAATAAGPGPIAAPPQPSSSREAPIVAEARAFMAEYARVLLAGDRAGIAAMHDCRGAHLQGLAGDVFRSHAEITARYRDDWDPPRGFSWSGLRFDPIGRDAVAVLGRFTWTPQQGEPVEASYTSVLVRQQGKLRIRVEHESLVRPRVRPAASE
jgi:hypothetical protein